MTFTPHSPPPELVDQWQDEARDQNSSVSYWVAAKAAEWSAKNEASDAYHWIINNIDCDTAGRYFGWQKTKSLSGSKKALLFLETIEKSGYFTKEITEPIRKAIEECHD